MGMSILIDCTAVPAARREVSVFVMLHDWTVRREAALVSHRSLETQTNHCTGLSSYQIGMRDQYAPFLGRISFLFVRPLVSYRMRMFMTHDSDR